MSDDERSLVNLELVQALRNLLSISRAGTDNLGNLLAISAVSCYLTDRFFSEKTLAFKNQRKLVLYFQITRYSNEWISDKDYKIEN